MRIVIIALGSRGDVQPFIALALRLIAAGHAVRVLGAADYAPLAASHGLELAPIVGSVDQLMDRELVYDFLDAANNPIRLAARFLRSADWAIGPVIADCWKYSQAAELLIASTLGMFSALHIAEKLNIPCVPVHLHPSSTTRAFPTMFAPPLPIGVPAAGTYNWLTHTLEEFGFWELMRPHMNRARQATLQLRPLSAWALSRRIRAWSGPVLYGYSALVAPRPADWSESLHVTGYWFLDAPAGWQPDPRLAAFLASGPPPVYVGFGSTLIGRHPDAVTRSILEALARTGQRAILHSGWGDLGNIELPGTVFRLDSAPHAWLFPRMSAVVHHGGAGTTAAALRAGVSSVIVPVYGDQNFWARRVHALGACAAPIPRMRLNTARLAAALEDALARPAIRSHAAALGAAIAREDGIGAAVAVIEQYASQITATSTAETRTHAQRRHAVGPHAHV
jgi:UDP:flavonoid glycosyltransferase YjiC (YdhE family)